MEHGIWALTNCYEQALPACRFVGLSYDQDDRENGTFAGKWEEWFAHSRFSVLEDCVTDDFRGAYADADAYVGLMHAAPDGCGGMRFRYLIGMFLPADGPVPPGFDVLQFDAARLGVCWIKGNEPHIFGREEACIARLEQDGKRLKHEPDGGLWCFERYVCPRFTEKDETGSVTLDIVCFIE